MKDIKNVFSKIFSNKQVVSVLKLIVFILLALFIGYLIFTGKQL